MSTDRAARAGPAKEARSRARPSASISSNRRLTAAPSSALASPICVRDSSKRRSVASMPQADNTEATRGTMTRARPSWRAISVACNPAAPPNANSAKRRGSTPRRTETSRTPSAMFVLMTRWMPRAAASRSMPSAAGDAIDGALGRPLVETARAAEKIRRIEIAEHEVGVGDGRARCRPGRSRPGRARRRRFPARHAGCRRHRPARSSRRRRRCEAMSRLFSAMRWPAILRSMTSAAWPSTTRQMSVLVPPISNGIRFGSPSSRAA